MNNVRNFKNIKEFKDYIRPFLKIVLGDGAEGTAYLTKDKEVIKIIYNNSFRPQYNPDILTTEIVALDSFLLPEEIYTYKGYVLGYKTKYLENDIFNNKRMIYPVMMNLEKLLVDREKMLKDVEIISSYDYHIVDLPYNLLYNRKKLAACDTLAYEKMENSLNENIASFDYALYTKLKEVYPNIDYVIDEDDNSEVAIKKLIKENKSKKIMVFPSEY